MPENEIWSSTSLSALRSSSADNRSSVIVLCNLFFRNAIRLNERSPEQLGTIKHMNMRSAMETFGNVSCSSSVCINLARSDWDEHPLHLAKVTKCTISSEKQQTVARCAKLRMLLLSEVGYHFKHSGVNAPPRQKCREVGAPFSGRPHAMAQLEQWLIRHWFHLTQRHVCSTSCI